MATSLSNLAPEFDANVETIQSIMNGNDTYEDLDLTMMEVASIEMLIIDFVEKH